MFCTHEELQRDWRYPDPVPEPEPEPASRGERIARWATVVMIGLGLMAPAMVGFL